MKKGKKKLDDAEDDVYRCGRCGRVGRDRCALHPTESFNLIRKLKHLTVREAWCFILDLTSDLVPCKMGKFYTRVCDIATGKLEVPGASSAAAAKQRKKKKKKKKTEDRRRLSRRSSSSTAHASSSTYRRFEIERNIYHTYELIDDDTMLEMSCFGLRDVVKGWRPAHSKDANETAKYSSYKVISTTPRRSRNQPTLPSRLQSRP